MKRVFEEIPALGDGDYKADTICVHRGTHYQLESCKPILLREMKDAIQITRTDLEQILEVLEKAEHVKDGMDGLECLICQEMSDCRKVKHQKDCKLASSIEKIRNILGKL